MGHALSDHSSGISAAVLEATTPPLLENDRSAIVTFSISRRTTTCLHQVCCLAVSVTGGPGDAMGAVLITPVFGWCLGA